MIMTMKMRQPNIEHEQNHAQIRQLIYGGQRLLAK